MIDTTPQAGDRAEIINYGERTNGSVVEIIEVRGSGVIWNAEDTFPYTAKFIKLTERAEDMWDVGDEEDFSLEQLHVLSRPDPLEVVPKNEDSGDTIRPHYYLFPGGVWTRHISAHLTSAGAQALQYIARSTRLDGNIKGDPVENIDKAILWLQWEKERLVAEREGLDHPIGSVGTLEEA